MSIFWNMDRKVLKNGGRKAPVFDPADFQRLLETIIPPTAYEDPDEPEDFDARFYDAITEREDIPFLSKLTKDLQKVNVDSENTELLEYGAASNGVPYALMYMGGDWESPVYAFLYFDGKDLRGYIPTYGNPFNAKLKSAFGSEDGNAAGKYVVEQDGQLTTLEFTTDEEYTEFIHNSGGHIEMHKDAMLEDFTSRVEPSASLTTDDINAAIEKARVRTERYVREQQDEEQQEYQQRQERLRHEQECEQRLNDAAQRAHLVETVNGVAHMKGQEPNFIIFAVTDGDCLSNIPLCILGRLVYIMKVNENNAGVNATQRDADMVAEALPGASVNLSKKGTLVVIPYHKNGCVQTLPNRAEYIKYLTTEIVTCSTDEVRFGFEPDRFIIPSTTYHAQTTNPPS